MRDTGKVNISINLELSCGPNGEWSVHKAYIGDNQASWESSKSGTKAKEGNGPNEASTSYIPKPKVNILNPIESHGASTSATGPKPTNAPRPRWIWQPRVKPAEDKSTLASSSKALTIASPIET